MVTIWPVPKRLPLVKLELHQVGHIMLKRKRCAVSQLESLYLINSYLHYVSHPHVFFIILGCDLIEEAT